MFFSMLNETRVLFSEVSWELGFEGFGSITWVATVRNFSTSSSSSSSSSASLFVMLVRSSSLSGINFPCFVWVFSLSAEVAVFEAFMC